MATIAPWLGHESTQTTPHLRARRPPLKKQAIARTAPLGTKPGRYHPAVRARSTKGSLTSPQAAAVAAGATVWLVHSAIDWDWQLTAVSGAAIVLAATLYPVRANAGEAAVGR